MCDWVGARMVVCKGFKLLMMILENLSYEQGPCTLKTYDMCRLLTWQSSSHMFCDVTTCLIVGMLPFSHL